MEVKAHPSSLHLLLRVLRVKCTPSITARFLSVCMCVCMCVYVCVYVCVCMCACVHCLAMGARSSIFFAELALVFSVVLCHGYGHTSI